jgi:glycosyltransferase involved in cell wall biosynthesis
MPFADKSRPRLSIVIPAHNEADGLRTCVGETLRVLVDMKIEVVVVDDGSTDGTWAVAEAMAAEHGEVRSIRHEHNLGKGAALQTGFQVSTGELVSFLDADLDVHPEQIIQLMAAMEASGAQVIVASKLHPDSRFETSRIRLVLSQAYYAVVRVLFGLPLRDTQTGLKLFRRDVLHDVLPRMKVRRFASDLELLVGAHRYGYRMTEVPVEVSQQRKRHANIGPRAVVESAIDTLRVYYWASFWHWLSPSLTARFWILVFLLGLVLASVGVGSLLSRTPVPAEWRPLVDVLALRFLDAVRRDWLLVGMGLGSAVVAAIQLNKVILRAFARPDKGDLAGIASRSKEP